MDGEDVKAEYDRRRARGADHWGWSFAYTPMSRLKSAKVIQIALNPRGDERVPGINSLGGQIIPTQSWETTDGKAQNAFVDQTWGTNGELNQLQKQVRSLYAALGVGAEEVFAANLVPFTSPSWECLFCKQGALEFSRRLWAELLPQARHARVFVVIGEEPRQNLVRKEFRPLIGLPNGAQPKWHEFGWKKRWIGEYDLNEGKKLLALPHLSRNRILSGDKTTAREIVSGIAITAGLPGLGHQAPG